MRDPEGNGRLLADSAPGETVAIDRLKRRADFLRAAKGKRWHGKAFSLQASRPLEESNAVRIGLTVTKKVGNAVVRNRARRRLREAIRLHADLSAQPGHDYVLVARVEALRLPFAILQSELSRAVRSVHAQTRPQAKLPRRREADVTAAPTRPHE